MSDFEDRIKGSGPKPARIDSVAEPHGPDRMSVEYTLTLEDVRVFLRYHRRHAPRPKGQPQHGWLWLVLLGLLSAIMLAVEFTGKEPPSLSFSTWWPVLLFVVYAFFYFFGNKLLEGLKLRGLQRNPRFFEKKTLAITPEALAASDSSAAETILWHAIERVIEQRDHAFFYISATHAHILPKRAFAEERQFEEFVKTARRYHAEARRFVKPEGQA